MSPRITLPIANVRQLPQTHTAEIPPEYRDVMGHMNIMWYTHLFDHGIYGLFVQFGFDLQHMQTHNAGSFALESHTHHLAEVLVGEEISIYSRLLGRTEKRVHLISFMVNETRQNLAATFEMVGAYIDMSQRRMAPIPAELSEPLDRLLATHQQLDWAAPVCGSMQP